MTSVTKNIRAKTFLAYLVFGGLTSAFCIAVGAIIFQIAPQLGFAAINVIAGVLGIFVNFALNLFYNFGGLDREKKGVTGRFVRFFLVALGGVALMYGLSAALNAVSPQLLNGSTVLRSLAQGAVLMLVAVLSYLVHAVFSFRSREVL